MSYCIGLDCGTTSVGWAALELDSNDEPRRIIKLGSRIFTAAENPKDGSPLAAPRREKRSMRRRLRRHRHRNERIRQLIINEGILSQEELGNLFSGNLTDIYQLRAEALDRRLTDGEFARVLIHIAQRRGFKSNRKNPADKDEGALLTAVSENSRLMCEKNYRTVGEMLYKDVKFADYKRNKGENYSNTISRELIAEEIRLIFEAQRREGSSHCSPETEKKYTDIVLSQRSFEEGPGGNSKYGGNQIEKMRGKCTLIPDEPRAPKAAYSFQLFTLWQKINSIRILGNGESRPLTDEERILVFNLAHEKDVPSFADIRKKLAVDDGERFNLVNYPRDKEAKDSEKSTKFNYLKAYHTIRKSLDKIRKGRIKDYSADTLDEIGTVFTLYKNDENLLENLNKIDAEIDTGQLMTLENFKGFGHISVKACRMLLPFLEKGMKYNEACDAAGFDFKAHNAVKGKSLPGYSEELANLTNPVVRRAVSQTIKVINAIIREQGESPVFINIELAREMSKDFRERQDDIKSIEKNRLQNERALERIRTEFGFSNARGLDLVKYKLWEEQDGVCAYSLKKIPLEKLFEPGYAEVDHILPYSISFDDTYKNKVLVLAEENRQKGNRLPLEYLKGKRRDDYIVWVNTNVRNFRKKQIMLKERVTEEDRNRLRDRSLQDTQYLSRFLYNYINDYLEFAPSSAGKTKRVTSVNGAITSYIRKRWGISKIREDGDLHHAADATVIACVTDGMIKKISDYAKYKEIRYAELSADDASFIIDRQTGEVTDTFPLPYPYFRRELEIRLSNDPQSILKDIILPNYTPGEQEAVRPCFVSRMPTRKIKGPAHKDTVRSPKALDEGLVITKKALTELKLDAYGEIAGYYNPGSDRLLYEALRQRLQEFDGNAEKAFAGPFYKPKSSGERGPLVKKVKICDVSSLTVPVNGGKGVAANDTMVRIDVFYVENEGYYFVPVYVADTIKEKLPNRAVIASKPYSEWKEMNDEDFIFSLYPNDIISAKSKKDIRMSLRFKDSTLPKEHISREELLYYVKAGIATASVTLSTHDSAYLLPSFGIKSLLSLEKYEVDVLGNCRKVGREKRTGFGAE